MWMQAFTLDPLLNVGRAVKLGPIVQPYRLIALSQCGESSGQRVVGASGTEDV